LAPSDINVNPFDNSQTQKDGRGKTAAAPGTLLFASSGEMPCSKKTRRKGYMTTSPLEAKMLSSQYDTLAPDGSEIRLLLATHSASMVHCTLPAEKVSLAVYHQTVDELWYFISGEGEVWRKNDQHEIVMPFKAGMSLSILLGTSFQFRNTGKEPLCFIIATMPPWPGSNEAIETKGKWAVK